MFKRIFLIVLDSVGCGYLPDADQYGDIGADTLAHIAEQIHDFDLQNMAKLGLYNIINNNKLDKAHNIMGIYGKMAEKSAGKDTPSGHWEICGAQLKEPFPTYPDGFPMDLVEKFIHINRLKGYLGNKVASGTEIIKELGEEHVRTGYPIIYTSADSVFQIAAHEEVIPLEQQYKICEQTRALLKGKHNIGRVIARPFLGESAETFKRTENRKDYAMLPPDGILTDQVYKAGKEVIGVGKIEDIMAHKSITQSYHTGNNHDGIIKIKELLQDPGISGLIFANLVDFDMLFGHRRNVQGYYDALKKFDTVLGEMFPLCRDNDALFITADHGNDPTFRGTDHTREYVPLLGYSPQFKQNINIGIRDTFSDLGQTIAEMLETDKTPNGNSFMADIIK